MAVRIPTYESHVNLDSGAHTVPRMHAADGVGKGLEKAGDAMMAVAAHWRARQEQFENFQMAQRETRAHEAIQGIIREEALNYDPGRDPPGTMHDRVAARIAPILQQMQAEAPARLQPYYAERAKTYTESASITSATGESGIAKQYYTKQLDKLTGDLKAGLEGNPQNFQTAVQQMTHTVNGAVNIPTAQRRSMVQAYTKSLAESTVKGYLAQGKYDDARTFVDSLKDMEGVDTGLSTTPVMGVKPQSSLSPEGGSFGSSPQNVQTAMAFFQSKGLSKDDAAAFVWNLTQESGKGIKTDLTHDQGTGYGIAGFRNERRAALFDYAGTNKPSLEQQLEFMWHELHTSESRTFQRVLNADTPEAKAAAAIGYFRPAPQYAADRARRSGEVNNIIAASPGGEDVNAFQTADAKPKVAVDPATGKMTMTKPGDAHTYNVVADAGGNIIGGLVTRPLDQSEKLPQQPTSHLAEAAAKMGDMTPQEQALYERHFSNLYGAGGVDNEDGSRSTLYQAVVEHDGKFYSIPTVWNGKILPTEQAVEQVKKEGWDKFPAYDSSQAADERYQQIHQYMDKDTADYFAYKQASAGTGGAPVAQPASGAGSNITKAPVHRGQWGAMSPWSVWSDTMGATIDAAQNKAGVKDASMKAALKNYVEGDIQSRLATGQGVTFDAATSKYFGVGGLTHDLIANKLGEAAALDWEDRRQTASRINSLTAGMDQMPVDAINQVLADAAPKAGDPNFVRTEKIYKTVTAMAKDTLNARFADPAAAADQMPDVKAALDKVKANPADAGAQRDLLNARIKAQSFLGIPDSQQSPITNEEASALAAPLLDRANANPNAVTQQVVKNIVSMTGNNPDLAHKALTRVLQIKGINDDKAGQIASALEIAGRPPAQPLPAEAAKPKAGAMVPGNFNIFGYNGGVDVGLFPEQNQTKATPKEAQTSTGVFTPGQTMLPADHIKMLRNDPTMSSAFDETYGTGASDWVFSNVPGSATANMPMPPSDTFSSPAEFDANYAPDDL